MCSSDLGPSGKCVAVHRTWLQVAGQTVTKAPLTDPKMTLGRYRGGAIRLWRGASGKPLKQAPAGDVVCVTEGIEDGLTVALAKPEWRVLCAVSLANMGALKLPDHVSVVIAADNDTNPKALNAFDRAGRLLAAGGRQVLVARASKGKDFNDLLRGVG